MKIGRKTWLYMIVDWEEGNSMPQPPGKAVSIHQRMQGPFDLIIFLLGIYPTAIIITVLK